MHISNLNRSITSNEIEAVKKKNLPVKRNPVPDGFIVGVSQMSEDLTLMFLNLNALV